MKLPNKAYEVEFDIKYSEISYLIRKDSTGKSLKTIKLPEWLASLIQREVKLIKQKTELETTQRIRKVLFGEN